MRAIGDEPLPGYRLVRLLGRGGFGEVWECEAPGGLRKAIKFVSNSGPDHLAGGDDSLRQEYEAFQQIKRVRHPFLLTLERVEVVGGELVMVMELADRNLADRFEECRAAGLPGIPRSELLRYLADAAEALDVIADEHRLQHLDVKPDNLLLVGSRAKVGDFGLLRALEAGTTHRGGFTPRYVSPEVLDGRVSPQSDQYNLALVYQELLTGVFPYPGVTANQIMMQHSVGTPELGPLPADDRPAVARALAKTPDDRFRSCGDFVRALVAAAPTVAIPVPVPRRHTDTDAISTAVTHRPPLTGPGTDRIPRSGLKTIPSPRPFVSPAPLTRLGQIGDVAAVAALTGGSTGSMSRPSVADFTRAVIRAATPEAERSQANGPVVHTPDGNWECRVLVRGGLDQHAVGLEKLRKQWAAESDRAADGGFVLRWTESQGWLQRVTGKSAGVEVTVRFPGTELGEAVVTGRVFGKPSTGFAKTAVEGLPGVMEAVRTALLDLPDRRSAPRVLTDLPMQLFPVAEDGTVMPAIWGRCLDVSAGGMRFETVTPLRTGIAYASFGGVAPVRGWAILTRVLSTRPDGIGHVVTGTFPAKD